MKHITMKIFILLLLIGSYNSGFSQNKDLIAGKWLNQEGDAQILIYQTSGKYSGRIVWLKSPNDENGKARLDKRNPDAALSRRLLIGTEILKGFGFAEEGVWDGGTLYDHRTGKTFNCIISSSNRDKINVRAFVGISVLGRTETWSRVR